MGLLSDSQYIFQGGPNLEFSWLVVGGILLTSLKKWCPRCTLTSPYIFFKKILRFFLKLWAGNLYVVAWSLKKKMLHLKSHGAPSQENVENASLFPDKSFSSAKSRTRFPAFLRDRAKKKSFFSLKRPSIFYTGNERRWCYLSPLCVAP